MCVSCVYLQLFIICFVFTFPFLLFFIHPLLRAPFPFAPSRSTIAAARNDRKRSETRRRLVDAASRGGTFSRAGSRSGFLYFPPSLPPSHVFPPASSTNAAPGVSRALLDFVARSETQLRSPARHTAGMYTCTRDRSHAAGSEFSLAAI